MVESVVSSSVWPSGADFATPSAATMVPEPGLFSTTTGWPQRCVSWAPTARAMRSMPPPAG